MSSNHMPTMEYGPPPCVFDEEAADKMELEFLRICHESSTKKIAELQRALHDLRGSCDPFNGNEPQWCSSCGAPSEAVRPGKTQCVRCEDREFSERMLKKLRSRLVEVLSTIDSILSAEVDDA
jgi:hypothetical protein